MIRSSSMIVRSLAASSHTCAVAVLVLSAVAAAPAFGQSLTVTADADTSIFLSVGAPTELLSNGAGSIFTGRTAPTSDIIQRGLVRFNVSSIPCGSVITGVELRMTLQRAGGAGTSSPVELHRLTSAWGEGASSSFGGNGAPSADQDANWIERFHPGSNWNTLGGDFAETISATTGVGTASSIVWRSTPELIADVSAWVGDSRQNFGWILINDEINSGTARKLASREDGTAAARPTLNVTFVPPCPADLPLPESGCPDGVVDGSDFIVFINSFSGGDINADPVADINGDGIIDGNDFVFFINAFSAGC